MDHIVGSPHDSSVPRPTRFLVKVCGITTLNDACLSAELGANALGFNFYRRSPRFIAPEKADEIIGRLPAGILSVGIVVLEPGGKWPLKQLENLRIQAVQVHGARMESQLPSLNRRILVATSPQAAGRFPNCEIVIDTSWGTGKLADWDALAGLGRPYILSGGLNPENIREALERFSPAGVDVCSGIESTPGRKDPARLRRFLQSVRDWAGEGGPRVRGTER